jgi:hypothetical protein
MLGVATFQSDIVGYLLRYVIQHEDIYSSAILQDRRLHLVNSNSMMTELCCTVLSCTVLCCAVQ